MVDLSLLTPSGRRGLNTIVSDPSHALIGFDYDGTLSPIVADPAQAYAQPGVGEALAQLAERVRQVAVITGRPARTAVGLLGLAGAEGLEGVVVLGQYGFERWGADSAEIITIDPPVGLARAREEIPGVLAEVGVTDAVLEDKGLAVAVHVRQTADPEGAFRAIEQPLLALATRTELAAEPGRFVVELRPKGMDKGRALLGLAEEVGARSLMFTGDDLGDLAAFDAVDAWRSGGRPGLLVCSGSDEVTALAERADLVVDGPTGVLDLIHTLLTLLS